MAEEKLGMIRTKLGTVDYDLFFTEKRIVAAKTGSTAGWGALIGVLGQLIAMHYSKKKSEQLSKLSIESIMTADKKNFEINYTDIVNAEVKKPGTFSIGKLIINTGVKKHKFLLNEKKLFNEHNEIFQKCLSSKIQAS